MQRPQTTPIPAPATEVSDSAPALRAGIVGAGYIGRVHAHVLRDLGVEVAGICGRTRESADSAVRQVGSGRSYDNLKTMLREERLEVLHVCTPNDLHAEQALLAIEHGAHVVCEKPLAINIDESTRMLDSLQSRGLVGAVAYHVRGYPLVQHMRARIAAGEIGDVRLVHGRLFCDDALADTYNWRLTPEKSGPSYVTSDLGTHWLDLAEHVTGLRVTEILAEFRTFVDRKRWQSGAGAGPRPSSIDGDDDGAVVPLSLEDYAALLLRFKGGASGSVLLSALAPGRKNQLLFECEGSLGGFTWDQESPNDLLQRDTAAASRIVLKDPTTNATEATSFSRYPAGHAEGYGGAFRNILREAYRAMAAEPHGYFPCFSDGYRGVQLLDAALKSARLQRWVNVP